MLSYRHGYHAGNHADVLKHAVMVHCIDYMTRKDTAFWVIDTHAGAGGYDLDSVFASKNQEHQNGVLRVHQASTLNSPLLQRYCELVRSFNQVGTHSTKALHYYPGSPQIALALLRPQDKLTLFELHSTEAPALSQSMSANKRQVHVIKGDGLAGLKGLLPPAPRRAFTLIDPAYELPNDYTTVVDALRRAINRFSTGVYALWYPVLQKPASQALLPHLCDTIKLPWLSVQLHVSSVEKGGMSGSGMFVINPPWTLKQELENALPEMVQLLGMDTAARYSLTVSPNYS